MGVTGRTVRNVMHDVLGMLPSELRLSNVVSLIVQLESELVPPFEG
jgi:hypothetical protein